MPARNRTLAPGQRVVLDIQGFAEEGEGVGQWEGTVVRVPATVPGDRVRVAIVHVGQRGAIAQIERLEIPSPDRVRPACILADSCGGCTWQAVRYGLQCEAKWERVRGALVEIGGFTPAAIAPILHPIVPAAPLGYRNKAIYPLAIGKDGQVKAGFYRKGTHRVVNANRCPAQDSRLDPLLADLKQDIARQGWSIYDEATHTGALRSLVLRVGRRTGEVLLGLVSAVRDLPHLRDRAAEWMDRYPHLVGVVLHWHPDRGNAVFGKESLTVAGRDWLAERCADLTFHLRLDTFFQVYTEQAEAAIATLRDRLALQGTETLVDAYAGVGTLVLPLAGAVQSAIAIERHPGAVALGQRNAQINGIANVEFVTAAVEAYLPTLPQAPAVVILDPPRKGCDPAVLAALRSRSPQRLAYMSCNPHTLARDLKHLCADGAFTLDSIHPFDFFPQTPHVEAIAFLRRGTGL